MKLAKLSLIAAMVLGGLVAFSNVASAQDAGKDAKKGRGFGPGAEQRLNMLSEQLKLTDEQKPKVKALLEEQGKKFQELRNDTSLDQQQKREKFTAMREEQTKKMKAILTPEQFEKYQALPAERGGKKGPGGEKKEGKKENKKTE